MLRFQDGKAIMTPVDVGPSDITHTVIVAGLKEGENVVVSGHVDYWNTGPNNTAGPAVFWDVPDLVKRFGGASRAGVDGVSFTVDPGSSWLWVARLSIGVSSSLAFRSKLS